jgi:hypothetical protein
MLNVPWYHATQEKHKLIIIIIITITIITKSQIQFPSLASCYLPKANCINQPTNHGGGMVVRIVV